MTLAIVFLRSECLFLDFFESRRSYLFQIRILLAMNTSLIFVFSSRSISPHFRRSTYIFHDDVHLELSESTRSNSVESAK